MQSQFELIEQTAKLSHINVRSETHGGETVVGADLKIVFVENNGILSEFHPRLRFAFYMKDENPQQASLEGQEPEPSIRVFGGLIKGFDIEYDLKGAEVVIKYGLGGSSDIHLETANINSFKVGLLEGGSVSMSFVIKCNPTSDQVSKLTELLGNEITISVKPAEEKQGSLGLPIED